MERIEAIHKLSRAHALVLRLHAAGADPELIADCLSIDVAGVRPLLEVAEAKFARLMGELDTANDERSQS